MENYRDLFAKFEFARMLMNSIVVTVVSCAIVMVMGVTAAYALARMKVPGEKHIALWILSLRFLPPIAVAIPFYIQWQNLHLLDTYPGLIIVYVAFNLPFAIWLLRGFLADVPIELEEAALLDGLTRLQISAPHRRARDPSWHRLHRDLYVRVYLERIPDGADADLVQSGHRAGDRSPNS